LDFREYHLQEKHLRADGWDFNATQKTFSLAAITDDGRILFHFVGRSLLMERTYVKPRSPA